MEVLLNLISHDPSIIKSDVIHWVMERIEKNKNDDCTILTTEELPLQHSNAKQIILKPPHGQLAYSTWKRFRLEPLIRKQNTDVVITWELIRSLYTGKQVLIASPVKNVSANNNSTLKSLKKIAQKAENPFPQIIVFSEVEKKLIAENIPKLKDYLQVIYRVSFGTIKPLSYEERESVKEEQSDGNEFFIVPPGTSLTHLTTLLKGFSKFKKWQKSSMELFLSFETEAEQSAIQHLLEHYRFHESIRLVSSKEANFDKILSSSYAIILPEKFDSKLDFLFSSLQAEVPVLIPEGSVYSELTGEAAFYFDANDKESITRTLLQIFKEENLRSQKIKMGNEVVKKFSSYNPGIEFSKVWS